MSRADPARVQAAVVRDGGGSTEIDRACFAALAQAGAPVHGIGRGPGAGRTA